MTTILSDILHVENLAHLLVNFTEQGVTDSILGVLSDSDLKELGIQKLGERKRLLLAFKNAQHVYLQKVTGRHGGAMVVVTGGILPEGSALAGQVVADFSIGRTEVTWGEWKAVRDWAVVNGYADLAGVGGTYPENGADNLPVVEVSWYDVVKWCNARSEKEGKTAVYQANGGVYRSGEFGPAGSAAVTMKSGANGYRLPLEKEWEWAARGGVSSKGYTYSGGNVVGEVAWIDENSGEGTKAVGGKKANELGLYDMSGNVWEWVWDVCDGTSYRRYRGGNWALDAYYAEVSDRGYYYDPDSRNYCSGFRVAFSSVP